MLTDSDPIRLSELRVQAFRGVGPQVSLRFDEAPVTILFGGNHAGKSSILNALDWILFSKDSFQGSLITDRLRERVSWDVRNRDVPASLGTRCIAVFSNGEATCELTRCLSGSRSRSSTAIRVQTFDRTELTDDPAEHFIATQICPSFRDFMSTVYLHQEVIRDVLTIKPEERGDAIDRLLGLAPLRELARALKDAKLARFTQDLDGEIQSLEGQLEALRRDRQRRIDERVSKAAEHNLKPEDLTFARAADLARESLEHLGAVATSAGLAAPAVQLPVDEKDLQTYITRLEHDIQSARTDLPDVKKLAQLTQHKTALSNARAVYEEWVRQRNQAKQKLAEFIKEKGDRARLEVERTNGETRREAKSQELRQHNARAAAIKDAIQCLEAVPSPSEVRACPVCGTAVEGEKLLEHLKREADERLDARSSVLSHEIKELQGQVDQFDHTLRLLGQLETNLSAAESELRKQREPIGNILQIQVSEEDDPQALLDRELANVDVQLAERKNAAEKRLLELKKIEDHYLSPLRLIAEVLAEYARLQELGGIQERVEFKSLRTLQREAASLKAATEAIGTAAAGVSQTAAKQSVERAGQKAGDIFVRVADHPKVRDVRLIVGEKSVGGILRNEYNIEDGRGNSVVPILSQGDMNALALGLFVGLGLASNSARLGFMVFDDPTQSLAEPQKERFAEVLNGVAELRQVIIATIDAGFLTALRSRITKHKRVYEFKPWTAEGGPQIAELD